MGRKNRDQAAHKGEIIKRVHKHVQKGQHKKAIAGIDLLLARDPADVRLQHKKADLLLRTGKKRQAMALYSKVAAGYAGQCFHLKAIAVLKQILKCDGHRPDIHQRLADQYERVGLKREAICALGVVASHHERHGRRGEMQAALRRIFQLGKDHIADPARLGDLYTRAGMADEAFDDLDIPIEVSLIAEVRSTA